MAKKRVRVGDGLYTVGVHGTTDTWSWFHDPNEATLEALRLARDLVDKGTPQVKIHCDSKQHRIMTATAQQWVAAASEVL